MQELFTFVVIGLSNGSVYAIAGMGLVLTFKTSGIFNFAHGTQAALAAYLMYTFRDQQGLPWPVAALLAIVLAGIVGGLVMERISVALEGESTANRVVATVGLMVGVQSLLVAIYGSATLHFPQFLPTNTVTVGGVNVTAAQIIATVLAASAAAVLYVLFRRARLGVSMQAVVDDASLLSLQGTSPVRVRRAAWAIGSCFASVSGLLLATFIGLDAGLLTLLVVFSYGAAAVGAFDSLPLTYLGGLIVGVGQALSQRYLATNAAFINLPPNLPFVVLIVALLIIPTRKLVERGTRAQRPPEPIRDFSRPVVAATSAAGLVALAIVPHVVGVRLGAWTTALAYVIIFASLNLLVRISGQVSLCQLAFAATGASTFALAASVGVPWLLAVFAGGLVSMVVGAVVALPAIRLRGVYLAIITFGFGLVVQRVFYPTFLMFGGLQSREAPRPKLGPLDLTSEVAYYYVVLAMVVASAVFVTAIRRGRLGRLLRTMAESPASLQAHGTNTNLVKLYVFGLSSFMAGVAGAIIGPITGRAGPVSFDFSISLVIIAVLFIAGQQPVLSAVIAAGLFHVVTAYLPDGAREYTGVFFGAAALLVATRVLPQIAARVSSSPRAVARAASAARRIPPTARAAMAPPGSAPGPVPVTVGGEA